MAVVALAGLHIEIDERDRLAFRADLGRIIAKYGDQPHLRKQRNLEVKRALQMFIENCVNIDLVSK